MDKILEKLVRSAICLGASDAEIISSADISVENDLPNFCNGDPGCENYGLSPSCPPHVPGPSAFREWQKKSEYSVVVRIDIPSSIMFSDERREVMQLLHEIVSGVEHKAVEMGRVGSKAFAGGSCKNIFCYDRPECRALSDHAECRNPLSARPSMSGFGINVAELMKSAGMTAEKANFRDASDRESMTWVAGLVLVPANNIFRSGAI